MRGNFSKSLSYCEWDPVKIWYSEDFFFVPSPFNENLKIRHRLYVILRNEIKHLFLIIKKLYIEPNET